MGITRLMNLKKNRIMKDVKCPYCGGEQDIDHEDGYGYEEDTLHQQECVHCNMYFTYATMMHFSYEVYKASCLNDGVCEFEPTITYPKFATRMRCRICEAEREPTKEEKIKYNIPLTFEL